MKWVKHRIDAIDHQHLTSKYTLIETGVVFDKIEFVNYEVKFEACDGGSLVKNTSEYHTKHVGYSTRKKTLKEEKKFGGPTKEEKIRIWDYTMWLRSNSLLTLISMLRISDLKEVTPIMIICFVIFHSLCA